jgi:hypothetical protein
MIMLGNTLGDSAFALGYLGSWGTSMKLTRGLMSGAMAVALLVGTPATRIAAEAAPFCADDQAVDWLPALAPLSAQLGDTMGEPIECPHPAGDSDDTVQQTSTGLAILRATTGAPTFTDGSTRWALLDSGVVSWTGASLDPPRREIPCARQPVRGFGLVFGMQADAFDLLGCPGAGETGVNVAVQRFEHGWMVWEDKHSYTPATIYVLFDDNQHYARFDDTYSPTGDPISGAFTPPAGLLQPTAGFGKVWREGTGAAVRDRLGWATGPESAGGGAIESFQRGHMLWTPDPREVFVLAAQTTDRPPQVLQTWRAYVDTFTE